MGIVLGMVGVLLAGMPTKAATVVVAITGMLDFEASIASRGALASTVQSQLTYVTQ